MTQPQQTITTGTVEVWLENLASQLTDQIRISNCREEIIATAHKQKQWFRVGQGCHYQSLQNYSHAKWVEELNKVIDKRVQNAPCQTLRQWMPFGDDYLFIGSSGSKFAAHKDDAPENYDQYRINIPIATQPDGIEIFFRNTRKKYLPLEAFFVSTQEWHGIYTLQEEYVGLIFSLFTRQEAKNEPSTKTVVA